MRQIFSIAEKNAVDTEIHVFLQAIFWRDYEFIKFVCVDLKSNDMDVEKCRITGGEKMKS